MFLQQWTACMAAALQPFIPDHAMQFAQQLLGFLASRLSMAGHDRLIFGEAPSQARDQLLSGMTAAMETLSTLFHITICAGTSVCKTHCSTRASLTNYVLQGTEADSDTEQHASSSSSVSRQCSLGTPSKIKLKMHNAVMPTC